MKIGITVVYTDPTLVFPENRGIKTETY